eukprot:CAMPEP_0114596916 /NCGR_PEP_ID=MMETSP0125-20121206/19111_1 /TAXON_ID=485358 ORGANISM="Aristerostoma sp., Strain ATCC 50986" /NCGR_SAMPLE_ID=MMETSP0125 /ASSEMBLY_ACC=CAM_ASM_000245 /LENGTH=160 /DNA_ID=CAMNT_0001800775 /DNA_START=150 /DNA_END=632 /DNA_ORIENTATION=-
MDVAPTSEENAAFAIFCLLLVQAIFKYNLNFYIPISKNDENVARGHKLDSILKEKFWFRKCFDQDSPDEYVELTIEEILNGKEEINFVGLLQIIKRFCKEEYGVDIEEEWNEYQKDPKNTKISEFGMNMKYLEILNDRAKGKKPTVARWIRDFVKRHPKY